MIKVNIVKIISRLLSKKKSVIDFNIVGLDTGPVIDDKLIKEMEVFMGVQAKYLEDLDKKRRKLYDDFIEKKWTQERMQEQKRILIDDILIKIQELYCHAKEEKIYKKDYKALKENLLDLLFLFFSSAEDFVDIDHSIEVLEDANIIPKGAKKEIILRSPIGRWYSK